MDETEKTENENLKKKEISKNNSSSFKLTEIQKEL